MLLVPGIGTVDDLRQVRDLGVNVVRIAVHCTEADITEQHIKIAKELGMEAVGFLMMSHMNTPKGLLEQARHAARPTAPTRSTSPTRPAP